MSASHTLPQSERDWEQINLYFGGHVLSRIERGMWMLVLRTPFGYQRRWTTFGILRNKVKQCFVMVWRMLHLRSKAVKMI